MILELTTLLFFAFVFFLVGLVIVVYLTALVPASLTYSMEWSAGWWQLSITWIDPTSTPPAVQEERPNSPDSYDPAAWHALSSQNDQGWTLNPDDFITPAPTPPPPPPYVPLPIMTQERVIDWHTPGSDWDYHPAWGAFADFPFQEEEPPF
ncbi:hypothetical protein OG21DRAFT_1491469 [Imleria badia]|nr:hypothetical protein OG21DRAFT_1491469 [Imleria badia]